ncbi:MAG: hypothetical protein ACOWWR_03870 [Eubacteriales bacterium]
MFGFLLIVGFACIAFGFYLKKKSPQSLQKEQYTGQDQIEIIVKRLDDMEKILFNTDIVEEEFQETEDIKDFHVNFEQIAKEAIHHKVTQESKVETHRSQLSASALEKYRSISRLEDQNYSIDEICKMLNMNQGEVILLKKLNRDY